MVKFFHFVLLFSLFVLSSCGRDSIKEEVPNASSLIIGNWKFVGYEYKGKNLIASDCEKQGTIVIGSTMSGSYDRYIKTNTACTHPISLAGVWTKDVDNSLVLKYNEAGVSKTMVLNIDSVSSTELRLQSNDSDVDGNGTVDDAIAIYRK